MIQTKKRFLVILFLLIGGASSYGKNAFWDLIYEEAYQDASLEAEKLADQNFNYMYLAAVCSHLNKDKKRFDQLSSTYFNKMKYQSKGLTKLLKANYDESNYIINNFIGVVKMLNPMVGLKSAKYYFSHSLELEKSNTIAHSYLSKISNQNEQYEDGIDHAIQSINIDITNAEAYSNLAEALYLIGDVEGAIETLLESMQKCPKITTDICKRYTHLVCVIVALKVDDDVIGVPGFINNDERAKLIKVLRFQPNNYLTMVEHFLSASSYAEAEALLNSFTATTSAYSRYQLLKGILAIHSNNDNNFDLALDNLVNNNAFNEILELGNKYLSMEQFDKAAKFFLKIMSLEIPESLKMKAQANYGLTLLLQGEESEANEAFNSVHDFASVGDVIMTNIGIAFAQLGEKEKAIKYLLMAKKNCQSNFQLEKINSCINSMNE